jgi:hypothetical protein
MAASLPSFLSADHRQRSLSSPHCNYQRKPSQSSQQLSQGTMKKMAFQWRKSKNDNEVSASSWKSKKPHNRMWSRHAVAAGIAKDGEGALLRQENPGRENLG